MLVDDVVRLLPFGGRGPWFYIDSKTRLSLRIGSAISKIPMIWRAGPWLEERYIASNRRIFAAIVDSLRSDPERFLSSLQGFQIVG